VVFFVRLDIRAPRGIATFVFSTDLLRSFFIFWLFLPALVAHDPLVGRGGSVFRHSRLPAVLSALVLRTL